MTGIIFIIAGKEEGFRFDDPETKLTGALENQVDKTIEELRTEGYTQFVKLKQIGYNYTLNDGRIITEENSAPLQGV